MHGLPTCPPPQTNSTSTTGGKGMGTGWAPAHVGSKDQQFLPFKKALLYARSLKLKARQSGRRGARAEHGLPTSPPPRRNLQARRVARVWALAGHWHSCTKDQQFLPFKKALLHARSLKLKTGRAWSAWCKSGARPGNVPSHPDQIYALDGWQGVRHWLGTGAVADKDTQFPSS